MEVRALQSRTVRTLMASQVLGGVGIGSGIAVAALVAARVSGRDDLSGLASTTQVLGAALFTIPVAALMTARGRRIGLATAYLIGAVGSVLAIAASVWGSFALLLIGTCLFGAATTAANQARYAAVDLAEPSHRGRQLSFVVWATTIGSVLGPNMIGPGERLADQAGLPPLSGAWVFSGVSFVVAGALLLLALRPDPLLTIRSLTDRHDGRGDPGGSGGSGAPSVLPTTADPHGTRVRRRGSVRTGLRTIAATPTSLLGTLAISGGHIVMVAVMVMTPIHMQHGNAEVEVIGFVISVHILGMFGLSPVAGWLTDRWGAPRVVLLGVALLVVACALAGTSAAGWSLGLTVGLFLLGLGWSCTMVAGSGLVSVDVPVRDRSAVQGAADLVMGLSAAVAGALAGVVVQQLGYGWLGALGVVLALALGGYTLSSRRLVSLTG